MPTYDYHCEANGQTLEVTHRISERLETWGELCKLAGVEMGGTPAGTPISRLANGGNVVNSSNMGSGTAPPCATGGCCGGGMCGLG